MKKTTSSLGSNPSINSNTIVTNTYFCPCFSHNINSNNFDCFCDSCLKESRGFNVIDLTAYRTRRMRNKFKEEEYDNIDQGVKFWIKNESLLGGEAPNSGTISDDRDGSDCDTIVKMLKEVEKGKLNPLLQKQIKANAPKTAIRKKKSFIKCFLGKSKIGKNGDQTNNNSGNTTVRDIRDVLRGFS